jgi:hypothetical protein
MMKAPIILSLALLLSRVPEEAWSQDSRHVGVMGSGFVSCGKWSSSNDDSLKSQMERTSYLEWVGGYVSAMAVVSEDVNRGLHRTDPDGIEAWMNNYCTEHPLDHLSVAAQALIDKLNIHGK